VIELNNKTITEDNLKVNIAITGIAESKEISVTVKIFFQAYASFNFIFKV
tara:strand:+ start:691 stop:840 length:150 start_codon:yes stop_codon:yes gene_type:complete